MDSGVFLGLLQCCHSRTPLTRRRSRIIEQRLNFKWSFGPPYLLTIRQPLGKRRPRAELHIAAYIGQVHIAAYIGEAPVAGRAAHCRIHWGSAGRGQSCTLRIRWAGAHCRVHWASAHCRIHWAGAHCRIHWGSAGRGQSCTLPRTLGGCTLPHTLGKRRSTALET